MKIAEITRVHNLYSVRIEANKEYVGVIYGDVLIRPGRATRYMLKISNASDPILALIHCDIIKGYILVRK